MRTFFFSLLVTLIPVVAFAQPQANCTTLATLTIPGAQLDITRAEWIPAGSIEGRGGAPRVALPAHCRVEGILDKRTGVGGKTYGIGFAIALPENWTGQFLQKGGGGLNGNVATPLGGQAAGDTPALARGFAVVTTDTGHKGTGAFDGSFMEDQQAVLDFEYVAIGRVAALARQIIEAYYEKLPPHSYYVGCSTGGREAMLMTQRYPLYFDGVVVGRPGAADRSVEPGRPDGGGGAEPHRAEGRRRAPGPRGRALRQRPQGHRQHAGRGLRRPRRRQGRHDLRHLGLPLRSGHAGVQGAEGRRLSVGGTGRPPSRRVSRDRRTRRATRCTPASSSIPESRPPKASRDC